jgi:TonB family protein
MTTAPFRFAAAAAVVAAAAAWASPASAQYGNEYVPAKLLHQGTTSKPIGGTGTVVVQVQVNADGSHKAIKVIRSSNPRDNAAALQIAQNSTYRPARRGAHPIVAFYDFTLKFTGKAVAAAEQSGGRGAAGQVDRMLHAGNYAGAKALAQQALAANPSDPRLNSELGAAEYFLGDYPAAAAAFSKVSNVPHEFASVAGTAYIQAAQQLANSNSSQALAYARKALQISPSGGAYYSLGSAELAAGDATSAVRDLKKARDMVFADPKTDVKSRVNVDSELYAAYSRAGDSAQAQATLDEIKRLDPSNPAVGTLMANTYLAQGESAEKATPPDYAGAIADFEQAAKVGSAQAQVTAYTSAAFAESAMLQHQKATPTAADYAKMKSYADKALALSPNDAQANFAEGIALAGEYVLGGKSDPSLKAQALAALDKAKSAAQASGNFTLSLNVDTFIKNTLP